MTDANFADRRRRESLPRTELHAFQLAKLNALLRQILPQNQFYAEKLRNCAVPIKRLDELSDWPLTTKVELQPAEGASAVAVNRTYDLSKYVRYHRTSGTRGMPLVILDTETDWQWWIDNWQFVLDAAEVTSNDRAAMAFSFGPFIGFWTANDALVARGALVVPCGGMSSLARLRLIYDEGITVVCCTPSYALHLASLAKDEAIDLRNSAVRVLIVAGEPGGSIPSIRERIEAAWNARLVDHAGATEVGPWGYADLQQQGLHIVESEFIAEFLALDNQQAAADGELSELVLTNLGRGGAPLIRYRTGDLVRPRREGLGDNRFVHLPGGVLGRVDDMMIVRGVNVFPSAVEQILHEFPEVLEYRLTVSKQGEMDALSIEVEDALDEPQRIARQLHVRLGLHVDVITVPAGSLPRFELKGQRFVDKRK